MLDSYVSYMIYGLYAIGVLSLVGSILTYLYLPQALKMVIPGIVNSFIALFKDTTLVLTIGLFDLLGTIQIIGTNAEWLGFHIEGYVFTAFIFWIFCFGMSRYSLHLEKKLHTGH